MTTPDPAVLIGELAEEIALAILADKPIGKLIEKAVKNDLRVTFNPEVAFSFNPEVAFSLNEKVIINLAIHERNGPTFGFYYIVPEYIGMVDV